jgi:hypothetical protein
MRVMAVRVLSVEAGRYRTWGALAASTSPVLASASSQAEALTGGSGTAPSACMTRPVPLSSGPPMGS